LILTNISLSPLNSKKIKEIAFKTVDNSYIIDILDKSLLEDNDFILSVIKKTGKGLAYATKEQQNDKNLVLHAMSLNDSALEYVSKRLKNDKSFIIQMLKQNGDRLEYVSENLKDDREVVEIAITHGVNAYRYMSKRLKKDRELALIAVKYSSFPFIMLSDEFQSDEEIASITIAGDDPSVFIEASKLKKDKVFVLKKLKEGFDIIKYIDKTLIEDKDILEQIEEIKNPLWQKIVNPLSILLFGLFSYWFFGRKKCSK